MLYVSVCLVMRRSTVQLSLSELRSKRNHCHNTSPIVSSQPSSRVIENVENDKRESSSSWPYPAKQPKTIHDFMDTIEQIKAHFACAGNLMENLALIKDELDRNGHVETPEQIGQVDQVTFERFVSDAKIGLMMIESMLVDIEKHTKI